MTGAAVKERQPLEAALLEVLTQPGAHDPECVAELAPAGAAVRAFLEQAGRLVPDLIDAGLIR
jgi:hypothetical protein